ncbi:cyclin-dependent kinase inhibitor 1B-like [Heterodontus francisci]|uniref:cyclin-dependent kinase inhibitor 1B-like n=1 Tax=Heterodontus francisci TaxID=7792 RepID=UPI00355BA689
MSDLSSSAMVESERRRQPRYLNKAVCRSLFGRVDHEELRRDLKNQLREIKNSHCQRWNFDFENHSPLAGNYIWEALDTRDFPSFYRDGSSSLPVPVADNRSDPQTSNLKQGTENSGKAKENGENNKKSGSKSSRERKRESPAPITDFFPKRKTIMGSKSCVETASVIPGERTPRKRIR